MGSRIDPTKPTTGTASTADVRTNFAIAKTEIEALQTQVAADSNDSPTFTGTANFANGIFSGTLGIAGLFSPASEAYILQQVPTISISGNISSATPDATLGGLKFSKDATGNIALSGAMTVNFTSFAAPGRLVAPSGLNVNLFNSSQNIYLGNATDTAGYGFFLRIQSDGSVWLGIKAGGTNPGTPYSTLVHFSGVYRRTP